MDERICAARLKASYLFPYFSSALFALIPIETTDLNRTNGMVTMGVDKRWRMTYHPGIFDQWTVDEVAAVMVHESMHLLRDHCDRAEIAPKENHLIWNLAADCEINDDLKTTGMPKGVIYPQETFGFPEGLLAEEYYNLLLNQCKKISVQVPNPGVGSGICGGCATGEGDGESVQGSDGDTDGRGNTSQVTGITGKEVDVIKNTVAKDVVDYQKSKGRGSLPAGLARWAEELLKSTVPWRTILQGCIRGLVGDTQGIVNYTYSRPARRQSVYGKIIMPSLRAPKPNIGVVVDTSGSMSDMDLGIAVAEVDGILRSLGVDVTVISNDASVGKVQRVRTRRQIELVGGGGTDLGPGIERSAQLKPKLDFLVVISDADAAWGNFIPHYPVILVKVGQYSGTIPEWIKRVIEVKED